MKSEKDSEKVRELLFRKFDDKGDKDSAKKKASESSDSVSTPGFSPTENEPLDKTVKYAIGGFAVIVAILLMSSFFNTTKFYFKPTDQGAELLQGRFAPMGEKVVATIPGVDIVRQFPEHNAYSKRVAYGAVFEYLVAEADNMLNTSRTPDLQAVRSTLMEAAKFAVTSGDKKAIWARLNSIDFLVISGKADLALNKGTMDGFEAAKNYLTEAIPYATTDIQKEIITKRLAAIEYAMASKKISKGEKQLAQYYREALDRHLRKAKQYDPEKSQEIDAEITKIRKWLDEFDKRHIDGAEG